MSNNWGMQDPDWQLRRLQQDCVRTCDRSLAALFAAVQQEVTQVHQEYEKIFGVNSAQFSEFINLMLQKLHSQGVLSQACNEWLSAAASGALPPTHAPASFNSQSQTLKQIPGEFRDELGMPMSHGAMPDDAEFETTSVMNDMVPAPQAVAQPQEPVFPVAATHVEPDYNNPWGEIGTAETARNGRSGFNSLMPSGSYDGRVSGANPSIAEAIEEAPQPVQPAAPVADPACGQTPQPVTPQPVWGQAAPQAAAFAEPAWGQPAPHVELAQSAWGAPSEMPAPVASAPQAPVWGQPAQPVEAPVAAAWGTQDPGSPWGAAPQMQEQPPLQIQQTQAPPQPSPGVWGTHPQSAEPAAVPGWGVPPQPVPQQTYATAPAPAEAQREDDPNYIYDPATAWD